MPLCRAVIDQNVFAAGFEHRGRVQGAQNIHPVNRPIRRLQGHAHLLRAERQMNNLMRRFDNLLNTQEEFIRVRAEAIIREDQRQTFLINNQFPGILQFEPIIFRDDHVNEENAGIDMNE